MSVCTRWTNLFIYYLNFPMCKLEKNIKFSLIRGDWEVWVKICAHTLPVEWSTACFLDNYLETLLLNLTAELALRVSLPLQTSLPSKQKRFYCIILILKRTSAIKLLFSKTLLEPNFYHMHLRRYKMQGYWKYFRLSSKYCRDTALSTCYLNKALK